MLCYRLPFEAESTQLLYKKIRQGVPSLPSHILPAASSLLHGMLEVAPEKRLALAHVATHEWLQLECEIPRLSAAVDAVVDFSASSLLSHPGLWMAAYRRPLRSLSAPCVRPRKAGERARSLACESVSRSCRVVSDL